MSVTKLKLISISGGINDITAVLYACVNDPYLHIEDSFASIGQISLKNVFSAYSGQNPYKELSSGMDNLASLAGINLESKLKTYDSISDFNAGSEISAGNSADVKSKIYEILDLNKDEVNYIIKHHTDRIKAQNDAITELNHLINDDLKVLEQLEHIGGVSANFDALFKFEFFKFRFGHMPREAYDSISKYGIADAADVFFIPSSIERNEVWGMYFTPRANSAKADSIFSLLHFERVRISERVHGTTENARAELSKEIEAVRKRVGELNAELKSIISETSETADKYYEKIYMLYSIYETRKKAVHSNSSFHFTAWLPEEHVERFSARLENLSTVVSLTNSPSEVPDINPPTLLKNFPLFKPFEQFVKMYGLPSYKETDPTPFLALTYILFFGIMFADLGQGLVLSAVGFLLWKLKGVNLGRIGIFLGLSSAVFGLFFGSVFGFEDIIKGYNPMAHINTVLISAVGLGVFIISVSIILNIVNGLRQKNVGKAVFSHNGIAGLLFYWGVIIAGLTMMKYLPLNAVIPVIIGLVILCLIVMYLQEPLANIIARKSKIIPHNPAEFFVVSFFEMFEYLVSYLSNTISFIRIGAFALSHVGMMGVVMLLAGSAAGGGNPFVIIIGNIVVIALEGLSVGIQCLRLEYYEIFSRFFDGGGRAFEHSELALKKFRNIKY